MLETTQAPTAAVAHTPREPGGEWHDLAAHLRTVAALAANRAAKFSDGELAYVVGLLHDIGKYNPAFQQYLRDAAAGREATSTPHAIYGALLAVEKGFAELAQPIYGHHAGMPSRSRIQEAFSDSELWETYERVKAASLPEVPASFGSHPPNLHTEMLLRMVFSCLVDSDYIDTEVHFDPSRATLRGSQEVATLRELLMALLDAQRVIMTSASGAVNEVRREVYERCLLAAGDERGVYRLAAPTGAGKTRSALAFGLRHGVVHGLDRVIYAVPFISITDQVAGTARHIFGGENVLEHHSGVANREPSGRNRLAVQNWEAPLIVTTTVQLLESLLSNRPSRCRKLHNVARSVIVLDEVQTLPIRLLQPIVSVLEELVERYGCTVVLSTATQPALEGRDRYLEGFGSMQDIVFQSSATEDGCNTGNYAVQDIIPKHKAQEHFRRLKRVRYEVQYKEWSWRRVAHEMASEESVMAVVNTRADAQDLHDQIPDALHLSASMCGVHRAEVLEDVHSRLQSGVCRLVSTQVVEAGVDLDFDTVLRAMGPLDSIVQAAGRCNREGRLEEGRVVVFDPEDGAMPGGQYRPATYQAQNLLRLGVDLHDPDIWERYFGRLYQSVPTDGENIQPLRRQFDYPEVAARFRLIEDAQQDVIIEYDERASRLVERIRDEGELRPGDLKRLQPYTVGLFPRDFEREEASREEIAEGVWLWTGEYDETRGLELRHE